MSTETEELQDLVVELEARLMITRQALRVLLEADLGEYEQDAKVIIADALRRADGLYESGDGGES